MPETKPELSDITKWADEVRTGYGERDRMYERIEKIFTLQDDDLPSMDWVKPTISPDGRNALLGAVRLMTATDPVWDVPFEEHDTASENLSSSIEKFAGAIWRQAGRIKRRPIHYSAVLSALMYDEVHIADLSTKKLVEQADGGHKLRAQQINQQTPLLFDVIPPKICYPVFDGLGLAAHFSARKMKVMDVLARWPKEGATLLDGKDRFEEVDYCEWWDAAWHAVWIEGVSDPIFLDAHGLGAIPIACATVEGNSEFFEEDAIRQPFLWTLDKAGLYHAQNVGLTVLTTMSFLLGANPKLVAYLDEERDIDMDWSEPGGIVKMKPGEKLESLMKMVIDPSITQMLDVASTKGTESTIYRQALGEPLGGNAPFSMVALLAQAGRLPLVPYQRMVGWVIADAMLLGLRMLKQEGGARRMTVTDKAGRRGVMDFDLSTLPDDLELTATLEISMPQDERQQIQMAMEASSGEEPLVSRRFAREKWLRVGQPDDMQEEIWSERKADGRFMIRMQQEMQQAQQAPAPAPGAQPPAPGGMVGPGGPGGAGPAPEELLASIGQGGGAQPGLPLPGPMDQRAPAGMPGMDEMQGGMEGMA